ncbi:anti-sigma factor [Streptomyces sp. NPDC050504]|uniref:anti-sigma factor n=1 Tax=Streptomyces sp. NPDC050504 TaxID=3365618 RepID=UPI00378B67A9
MADHLTPHQLVELALASDLPAALTPHQRDHLDACAPCREELAGLGDVVRAARAATSDDLLTEPPASVWQAIEAELRAAAPYGRGPDAAPADGPAHPDTTARRTAKSRTRQGRRTLLLAAAALVLGAALGSLTARPQPGGGPGGTLGDGTGTATSAAVPLDPLAVPTAAGTARLVGGTAAPRGVAVAVTGLPATDGYYEVWLMDRTHEKLIAMGALGPRRTAALPLPEGVDLHTYPVLDVSEQPYDGNPAHSGRSVVRGELPVGRIARGAGAGPLPRMDARSTQIACVDRAS